MNKSHRFLVLRSSLFQSLLRTVMKSLAMHCDFNLKSLDLGSFDHKIASITVVFVRQTIYESVTLFSRVNFVSLQIEVQAKVNITKMIRPKMPTTISARKSVQVGHLYAICKHTYYEPKVHKFILYLTMKPNRVKRFRVNYTILVVITVMARFYKLTLSLVVTFL